MFKEYAFDYETIDFNNFDIPQKQTMLLNLKKTNFDILENFVKQTAEYHFKELNIDINKNTVFVEFWWKSEVDLYGLHVDCDEFLRKTQNKFVYPLLSCVSYFDDLDYYPTVLTNVDVEKYMFKEFNEESILTLVYPKKHRQITFNGSFFHGVLNDNTNVSSNKRTILAINLWNVIPTNVVYYNGNSNIAKNLLVIEPVNNNVQQKIYLPKTVFNENLFEQFLYKKNLTLDLSSYDFIKNVAALLKDDEKKIENTVNLKKNQIYDDIKSVKNCNNRFYQRFMKQCQFTHDVCDWIVYEAENYAATHGWTTRRHNKYPTTDLPAEVLPNVFSYLLFAVKHIICFIKKSYQLENTDVNLKDLFIVKYETMKQNVLEFHTDGSMISFNIALNSIDEYEGGGTCFEDGIVYKQNKGDLIVHSSLVKHAGVGISSGKRFILVGFLDFTCKAI